MILGRAWTVEATFPDRVQLIGFQSKGKAQGTLDAIKKSWDESKMPTKFAPTKLRLRYVTEAVWRSEHRKSK